MIDLHLHTIFSDGELSDISFISDRCKILSVTDHNTIGFYKDIDYSACHSQLLLGCEITIERCPDYIVYFPKRKYEPNIEEDLKKIRLGEEEVIKKCYIDAGYNNWETDISRAFSVNQKNKNARTRDLAAILYLYRKNLQYANGFFDYPDLKQARILRRKYTEHFGSIFSDKMPFDIANKHNGIIVLAHPIHTAIKQSFKNPCLTEETLIKLLNNFALKKGRIVEWEHFSDYDLVKYNLTNDFIEKIRNIIMNKAEEWNFLLTLGSDSHSLKDYENTMLWLKTEETLIKNRLADFIR